MEPNNEKYSNARQMKKYAFGVVIILAGLILLLTNTGFLPYSFKHIFFSWPMLLIAIGLISLFTSESQTPGYILLVIGGVFLLPRILDVDFNVMSLFWPVILIGIGVLILVKRVPRPVHRHHGISRTTEEGYIHEENVFGSSKQRLAHQIFRGGHINCVFGGSELDLSQATLAEGTSELEINTIFGGATLVIPSDWKVVLKTTSILGGFADKRMHIKESPDPSRILIIKGSTIFGGGEIKSY
jgi:predicted membrane protein